MLVFIQPEVYNLPFGKTLKVTEVPSERFLVIILLISYDAREQMRPSIKLRLRSPTKSDEDFSKRIISKLLKHLPLIAGGATERKNVLKEGRPERGSERKVVPAR